VAKTSRTSSARDRAAFTCSECGWQTAKWVGRCGECQTWGSVIEAGRPLRTVTAGPVTAPAVPISEVDLTRAHARPTGVDELDRVLGGGLVPGSVVLLAGEPGVGKSTLLLEVASTCATASGPALYVTGEESAAQVRLRAERVGALSPHLFLASETDLSAVLGQIEAVNPSVLIVDSVQTISSGEIDGGAGGVSQVREVAGALIRTAKERGMACILVGHVTKDGSIAGPRLLEHLVDVVLSVEGDRHARLRLVRAIKNRYGAADEVGCFELSDSGIVGLPDPSGLFMTRRDVPVPGTAITVTIEGSRPLMAEVQALVAGSNVPTPRRATHGVESSRVAMVLAVLERRGGISLAGRDIYVSTVGGVRMTEPAVDLAVMLAVAGAAVDAAMPNGLVVVGEVGLAGEVRRVQGTSRRLSEAARLGFTTALVPKDPGPTPEGMRVIEVDDVREALTLMRATGQ
jgi:DNA repair protein RadA/Sms